MLQALDMIVDFLNGVVGQLDKVTVFNAGAVAVSFWDIILGFLLCSMIAAVFWKGARA